MRQATYQPLVQGHQHQPRRILEREDVQVRGTYLVSLSPNCKLLNDIPNKNIPYGILRGASFLGCAIPYPSDVQTAITDPCCRLFRRSSWTRRLYPLDPRRL